MYAMNELEPGYTNNAEPADFKFKMHGVSPERKT